MAPSHHHGAAATALLHALGNGSLTRAEAMTALDLDWRQMTNAARKLIGRGYLIICAGPGYQLTEAGIAAAALQEPIRGGPKGQIKPVQDSFRQRAWTSMRIRKAFTIGEIVSDAQRAEDGGQPRDNAARYINRLKQAGFVRELPRRMSGTAASSNGFKRFVLVRRSGPRAPAYRAGLGVMHDFTSGEDIPCAPL